MDTIKVLTLNMWGEQPPLAERMQGILAGLRAENPDVIGLQEVRQITASLPNQAETLAAALGMNWHFAVATPWGGGEEGLALLSRFPIVATMERELPHASADERRIVLGITVDTPAGPFSAFTTHLNYRLADGQKREDQVVAAEALVAETPAGLPKVLMGDMNAVSDSDEIRYLRGLRSVGGKRVYYQDAFAERHPGEPGFTWALRNPHTERLHWLVRDRRIDYIFVTPIRRDGRGLVRDCRIVLDGPDPAGLYPSDHFGLCAEIQVAPVTAS